MSNSIKLSKPQGGLSLSVQLSSSKSESNRVLLIKKLCGDNYPPKNLGTARDVVTMNTLLGEEKEIYDVLDAGTVMRFMTAYLAMQNKETVITGTARMCKRPIKILAEALNELGAKVTYEQEEGYPPLRFHPFEKQKKNELTIPGNISSQYISALLMIAPTLPEGLTIHLEGEIYSRPYIQMTLNLMKHFGVVGRFEGATIEVKSQNYTAKDYTIESDWSGASYWLSMVAMSPEARVVLKGLREDSNQGDSEIARIMKGLGVDTQFDGESVILTKGSVEKKMVIDFKTCPDLAQTVFVCAAVKGVELEMTGLESLRIKETDRTAAMATELKKIGAELVETSEGIWHLTPSSSFNFDEAIRFETYDDHRMAMSLAPLALLFDVIIEEPEVVVKSYPEYWDHLTEAGVVINPH